MAEAHKVSVVVSAIDKASAPLKRVSGGFNMLSRQGLAAGAMFAGVTIGMQAAMGAIQGIGQHISDSVTKFREFERSMSEVATMLNIVGMQQLPEMTDNIVKMSIAFGKSADDLARGLYQILSAGIDSSKSMLVLRESSKLAAATLTDVETAVDAVTTVLNAYGMNASRVGEITELFAKTIQLGKLRMDDLANALGYVVPIASQAGISIEEVSAAIATLTKQGINAHKAARGLRQVINQLVAPSEEAQGAMVDMGVAYDDLTVEAVGLEGVMKMINTATAGQIGEMTRLIPNVQALSAGLGLMADSGQIFANSADYIENKFGALDEMLQKVASDSMFLADQTRMVNEELDRQVGEVLDPLSQAWDDYWTVVKINLTHFGDLAYDGRRELEKMRENAEVFGATESDIAKWNTAFEITEGHFSAINDYIKQQEQLVTKLTARQALYTREMSQMTEAKDIATDIHDYQEALRYIPMALEDASYQSNIFGETTRALVDSIRMQREEIQRLKDVQDDYNRDTQRYSIAMMKIRLNADKRRGRMTRNEKRQMKELQLANDQLRLNTMENQLAMSEAREELAPEEKQLEKVKTSYAEQLYIMQDTYTRDQEAMQLSIDFKQMLLDNYTGYIQTANDNILAAKTKFYDDWLLLDAEFQRKLLAQNPNYAEFGVSAQPQRMTGWKGMNPLEIASSMGIDIPESAIQAYYKRIINQPGSGFSFTDWMSENTRSAGIGISSANVHVEPITINVNNNMGITQLAQALQQGLNSGILAGFTTVYG